MSLRDYYSGWNFARIGTGTVYLTASVGGHGADPRIIIDGTYSHLALTSVTGTGTYVALAAALQSYFNGLGGGRPTYTITFSPTTMQYTFSVSSGTLALTFTGADGLIMRHVLGFSGNVAATSSPIVSDVRPYYAIRALSPGPTNYTDEYETSNGIAEEEADDGVNSYSISRYRLPLYVDWEQYLEEATAPATAVSGGIATPGAGVRILGASSAQPWTWEHMYQHCRCVEPFALYDTAATSGLVCKHRSETGYFKPAQASSNYAVLWNLPFKTRLLGRL